MHGKIATGILLVATIPFSWINDDDSDRVFALRGRLEHIIRQTGPTDRRPTVLVEHSSYADQWVYQCQISTLDGKICWTALGDSPREAASDALQKYLADLK